MKDVSIKLTDLEAMILCTNMKLVIEMAPKGLDTMNGISELEKIVKKIEAQIKS
jgi:hypothetical protein